MGKITGICISEKRGVQKHFIEEANIIADWGIEGDAHGGKWHRQISLLSQEKVDAFKAKGADIHPGSFGENLIVEGFLLIFFEYFPAVFLYVPFAMQALMPTAARSRGMALYLLSKSFGYGCKNYRTFHVSHR